MPRLENAHALIIGISQYEHITPLPPTVRKDAQDIYNLFIDPRYCGYNPDNVRLLLDEQATKENIRQALATLAQQCNPDSTAIVYISSHGGRILKGQHVGEYLLPVDTLNTSEKVLAKSAIHGNEFTEALRAIRARKRVVLFDSCHAAGLAQPKDGAEPILDEALPLLKAGLTQGYYTALQAGTGSAIIASSRETEASWIMPGDQNSLFTKHLLAGLQGGVASEDGLVRIFDLFEYIQPRITGEKSIQHPVFKADLEDNLPLTLYLGGQKGPAEIVEEGFRYDAYINYVDVGDDSDWVWNALVPRLEKAGLRIAVSEDAEDPGVARVVGIQRAIKQSKRTVVVLSPNYLANNVAEFRASLAMSIGIDEGTYRVIPVIIATLNDALLPEWLKSLVTLNLAHPSRAERQFNRLLEALKGPLPVM
jgi:hypothetical protein